MRALRNDSARDQGEQLSGDELDRMGRAGKLAEAITPTRPHAPASSPRWPI
jgi:hypothetical protein